MSTAAFYAGRDFKVTHDQTVKVNDDELRYTVVGQGEPVLCIHCTTVADGLITPLLTFCPQLLEKYQFISYYRVGYNGSTRNRDSYTMEDMADHARQVLDHVGVEKAHVLAYSFGGVIGFQFLMAYPERAASGLLLEPYLMREEPGNVTRNNEAIQRAFDRYAKGDKSTAAVNYMADVCGPSYLSSLDLTCPLDVWEWIDKTADTVFQVDFPALANWGFAMSRADSLAPAKPTMPVLSLMGEDSEASMPGFREIHHFLLDWLPQAERLGVKGVGHGLQIQDPVAVGTGIAEFLSRHPIGT
ncbi:MAG: alpha/beta hydrolase [Streptosporangiaceae bacterium]|nr:alpha/beta hydrolase [Streptosporangiaceae bacterium]